MQTHFTSAQREDPGIGEADKILRACVHCGFCTATCPTYVLRGDELDSPRGRIYLIKEMLETGKPADARTALHVDRCLSCLSCMTSCPSGVNYMHLVDMARARIAETRKRPLGERVLRALLARLIPYPSRFRWALRGAALGRPFAGLLPGRLRAMIATAPKRLDKASHVDRPQLFAANGKRSRRVALMTGCAQQVLAPRINEATVRVLTRLGCEVVVAQEAGCCGSFALHMGRTDESQAAARANIDAWMREAEGDGLDAVIINASGCGTTVKDYRFMLRGDAEYAEKAALIAGLAKDVAEFLDTLDPIPPATGVQPLTVAYHSACSMQHGQGIREQPKAILRAAGFEVREAPEGHLCCGWAGTYNLLQPEMSGQLRARKVANIESLAPDVVATGNFGCMTHIAAATELPVVHTVELLDWASGGPKPAALTKAE